MLFQCEPLPFIDIMCRFPYSCIANHSVSNDVITKNVNTLFLGQYGMVSFSGPAFVAFFIATIISILDSMGDYFACARTCQVSAPPAHAVNRGILIEGLCTFLSGSVGCGHATTTYGDTIGALAITKVLS